MAKQGRSEATRRRIMSVAAQTFARNGYNATGIAEICERAGVSKGAFYYHFDNKQAVFLELLNSWMAELEEALETLAEGAETVPERLARMARMLGIIFRSQEYQMHMFLEFWTQASRDESVRQATMAPYRKYQAYFAALLQQGIDEGTMEPIDAYSGAQALISLASGLLLQGLLDPQNADWDQVSQDSVEILLNGLKRRD
jgi:AcrR family transcriptional regulator